MIGVLVAALLLGSSLTETFPIPDELINLNMADGKLGEGLNQYAVLSAQGIPIIWFHNLQVILIATVIGLFTYGVVGILVMMLPFILIGYFMETVSTTGVSAVEFFGAFVLPHGIFEIPAILLAGGSILLMGSSLAAPSEGKKIGEGMLYSLADWAKIMVGLIMPLLLIAAIIEALVTPQIAMRIFGG